MGNFKIFLSSPPDMAIKAAEKGPVSIMGYRMGRGFHLYRTALPQVHLSLMDIDCAGFTGFGPHEVLVSEIMRECAYCGYSGICLGLESSPTPQLLTFCRLLAEAASYSGVKLYLPESFSRVSEYAMILIRAQNTSGLYKDRLRSLCTRYGAGRIALELERVYTDFALPARTGLGSILSQKHFNNVSPASAVYYSGELCAHYLSYMKDGRAHLVLWDEVDSLIAKCAAAQELGIHEAFLYYPHVQDILDEIHLAPA
ncbi:MAG: hypothetical protein ACI3VB_00260 [Oscillospiraceae bacterium]